MDHRLLSVLINADMDNMSGDRRLTMQNTSRYWGGVLWKRKNMGDKCQGGNKRDDLELHN